MLSFTPLIGEKFNQCHLPFTQMSSVLKHPNSFFKPRNVSCNVGKSAMLIGQFERGDFLKLQNGSDIRGVAISGVDGEPVTLTEAVAQAIAAAFCAWLLEKKGKIHRRLRVSIGYDSRVSAEKLQDAVSRGITGSDLDVVHFGLASTPAMFYSTLIEDERFLCPVDGSIMITASHLPYNRNGFKFFTNAGGLGKGDIKDLLDRASHIYNLDRLGGIERNTIASRVKVNFMDLYASNLVEVVRKASGNTAKPLEGFHIVVDAGNGAGGFFVEKVLHPLGATTSGSQFLEPDGLFPNHIPNPEDKVAMSAITKAVLDNRADLGIIFDTDVDRSAAVDSSGCEFNRNRLIALISAIILEDHPGTTIVTDSVTSDGLATFIHKKLGGKHHRFKRGYKNVIDEAIRLVKILNKLASARSSDNKAGSKIITDLVGGLVEPKVSVELRLKIDQSHSDLNGRSFREYGETVLKHLENHVASDSMLHQASVNHEGVRVSGWSGWFLLRLSLHDPVLPLNVEADNEADAVKLALVVSEAVSNFPALDVSAIVNFCTI